MPKKKTKSSIPRKYRKEEPVYRMEAPKKSSSKLYNFDKRYYFNLKAKRWKRHIDGDWDNGPLIFRVPLEPEQAVLSCCTATGATRGSKVRMEGTVCKDNAGAGFDGCTTTGGGKIDCGTFEGTTHPEENSEMSS